MVERCKQCNGIIRVGKSAAHSMMNTTIKAAAWCKCPDVKHDGNLDTSERGCQGDTVSHYLKGIALDGDSAGNSRMHYYLTAKQALSLLEWLQQEKETLEKLAQEINHE